MPGGWPPVPRLSFVAAATDTQSTRGSLPRSGNRAPRVGRRSPAGSYWRERVRGLRPQQEEVPVSFASEPGRDDGSLPPVNIVIPDDARELDRDVLAYRRELRARRRRQRITRLFGPLHRRGLGGQAAILPLIATCVALSMLAGAMLSVMTISPADRRRPLSSPRAPRPARHRGPDRAARRKRPARQRSRAGAEPGELGARADPGRLRLRPGAAPPGRPGGRGAA